MWNGGTLATAGGLVFQGIEDGSFRAYNALNGRELWKFDAKLGIIAAPMSFGIKSKQYVALLVGYGGSTGLGSSFVRGGWKYGAQPRRLLVFSLDGRKELPKTPPRDFSTQALDDPSLVIQPATVQKGADGLFCEELFYLSWS